MDHVEQDRANLARMGSVTEIARLMRVRPQAVSQWKRNGIPDARRQTLALLRPDLFVDALSAANGAQSDAPPAPTEEARDAA